MPMNSVHACAAPTANSTQSKTILKSAVRFMRTHKNTEILRTTCSFPLWLADYWHAAV